MTDRKVSNESLLEIFLDCKKLIQQCDEQLKELSMLLDKSNWYTGESYIRELRPQQIKFTAFSELILDDTDFIEMELLNVQNGEPADGSSDDPME
ncbi:hypothetical protein [Paenibacillus glycanilyticus]|uniref:Uncharacterized protein n=1 Tax=Paenibacillus glycanilyticus TaxID=126569 RepID=A0ABQ6GAL0_9BACL|nr:hypothetical protein [Paenibacillus glycanilyticus]GLX66621.1 hypothetical protein MU1_09650 [Paenibacillus glycanilyticus]